MTEIAARPTPTPADDSPSDRSRWHLSVKEKIGYSLGDAASNLYFQTFVVFLPIFYTDVFGISAGAMGTMLLVTRFFDAANDPIVGMIADRTRSRWGKFRPYIAGFALPLAVAGILAFTSPVFGPGVRLAYAFMIYSLLMVISPGVTGTDWALMGVLAPNTAERTNVSQYEGVAAFNGQCNVDLTAFTLVEQLGVANEQLVWRY